MLDPPGTMRTPLVSSTWRTGNVALSRKGCRIEWTDMSTTAPMRKPRRMPFLTQPLTRQPLGVEGSGSAARILPAFSAFLKSWKRRKCSSTYAGGLYSNSFSISACNGHSPASQQARGIQHGFDLFHAFGLGGNHGQA